MEDSRIMRTNVERKIGQIANTIFAKGGTDGQDHRRGYAPKHRAVILEDGVTNQLGEPYRVLNHRAFRLLSDNDPSVIQDWVRDDAGIRRPLFAKVNHEVLLVRRRDRQYFVMCLCHVRLPRA